VEEVLPPPDFKLKTAPPKQEELPLEMPVPEPEPVEEDALPFDGPPDEDLEWLDE
jgi:hypothetical protein